MNGAKNRSEKVLVKFGDYIRSEMRASNIQNWNWSYSATREHARRTRMWNNLETFERPSPDVE